MPDAFAHVPPSPRRDAAVAPLEGFGPVFRWGLRRGFSATRFRATALTTVGMGILLAVLHRSGTDAAFRLWVGLDRGVIAMGVPLVALALAGGGYAEEVADQTLVYHLVRPVSRATVFLARFAAGILPTAATAATLLLVVMLFSGARLPALAYVEIAAVGAVGATAVGAVYYALAALFRRGLVAGLVYTFVVETICQFLPGSVQNLSLMHHVRSLFHRWCDPDFAAASKRVADRIARWDLKELRLDRPDQTVFQRATETWSSAGNAVLVCAAVVVGALALGAWAVKRRDYALKES